MNSSSRTTRRAVARVLARQSDYYAVLGVRKDTAAPSKGKLRERYDALVNAIERAPRGKDREDAVSVAQSAHATLANPLTRAMYDGWRAHVFPAKAFGRAGTPRGSHGQTGHVPRWCRPCEDAGGGFGVCDSDHGFIDPGGGAAAAFAVWWLLMAPIRACDLGRSRAQAARVVRSCRAAPVSLST